MTRERPDPPAMAQSARNYRFFCPPLPDPPPPETQVHLDEQQAHHAQRVLRLKVGEAVELFDGCGRVGRGVIQSGGDKLIVKLTELHAVDPPQPALDLAVAIPKGPRADDMVNQLGQLGVDRLIALHTQRSVVDPRQMKLKRFAKLAVESARQSGRAFVMQIAQPASLAQVLTMDHDLRLVATPDADKFFLRRRADWIYTLFLAFSENDIKSSIKRGDYTPDTTASPYNSLLAYKARSLNGIWATAPYLHNGSVPTLYDLLLPVKSDDDPEEAVYRTTEFMVGSREFDTKKVGFKTSGYEGFEFRASRDGNLNTGHEYGRPLSDKERWELIEYLKTL